MCRTKLLGKACGCKQLRLSLSPDAPSWPAQQTVLTGPDPWPVLSGGLRRNHPLLQTLSQTHTELPHAGKWCMETWPVWWGNLLGTDRKALGRSGKPGPTGTGTSLQGGLPRAWPRLRSVWMPATPQPQIQFMPPCGACGLGSLCSFSLHVSEPVCISPSPDRCVCLQRGHEWQVAFIFFFPSKQ